MVFIELLTLSVLSVLFLLVVNTLGKVIRPLFIERTAHPYFNFFLETLLGVVSIVALFSIFKTHFITINIVFFILLSVLWYRRLKNKHGAFTSRITFKDSPYLGIIITGFLCTFLNAFILYKGLINEDILFYLRISEYLGIAGKENFFHYFNEVNPVFEGVSPYHYFEFWLSAIFFKFTNGVFLNSITFKYLTYGTLRFLCIIGLAALIETFKKVTFFDCCFLLILTLFDFQFLTEIGGNDWGLQHNMWTRPNIIVYMLFLIPVYIFIIRKETFNAIIFLMFLPVASTVTAPAVFSAAIGYLFILSVVDRQNIKSYFKLIGLVCLVATAILIFYKVFGSQSKILVSNGKTLPEIIAYTKSVWKAILFFTVTLFARFSVIIILVIVLAFLFFKDAKMELQNKYGILVFPMLVALSGILFFQMTTFVENTYQLPYVGYTAGFLTFIYLFYFIAEKSNSFKGLKYLVFTVIAFCSLYYLKERIIINLAEYKSLSFYNIRQMGPGETYAQNIDAYFKSNKHVKGGFIISTTDLNNMYGGMRSSNTFQLGSYLAYLNNNSNLQSLTSPDSLYAGFEKSPFYSKAKGFNDQLPFYRGYDKSKDYQENLVNYIDKTDMDYIVMSKNFDLSYFDNLEITKVYLDEQTGHRFAILKK